MFLPSQSWNIVLMLCPCARHFTLKCLTWLRWKWVPGRTGMVMCTIDKLNAPKWLQDCMLSVDLKLHTNEQFQWPDGKMWSRQMNLQTWYQAIKLQFLRNYRRYTGFYLNSTMPQLTCSSSHTEKGETRVFLWKPHTLGLYQCATPPLYRLVYSYTGFKYEGLLKGISVVESNNTPGPVFSYRLR